MDKTIYFGKRIIRNAIYAILVAFSLSLQSCSKEPKATILFVGDILLSRNVKQEIDNRQVSPWVGMDSLFQSSDLLIGNLEGAVSDRGDDNTSISDAPIFRIEKDDIKYLTQAGFDMLSMENNHSYDYGIEGRASTFNKLSENSIQPLTFEGSPFFFHINEITISLISINVVQDIYSKQETIPSRKMERIINLANALSDLTIVKIHWGSELLEWPDNNQRMMADWLTKKGVDLVIGTHPHVIQKPEIVNGKPVYFSLGNHLFDQKYASTKNGLIAKIEVLDDAILCAGLKTTLPKNSFYPYLSGIDDFNYEYQFKRKKVVKINGAKLKGESISFARESKLRLQSTSPEQNWVTKPIQIESIESFTDSSGAGYLFMLKNVHSSIDNEKGLRPYVYNIENGNLVAKWRGSALAWPLIDARILREDNCTLCALHRGDSFINLDKDNNETRIAAYTWNGFGFTLSNDPASIDSCTTFFNITY